MKMPDNSELQNSCRSWNNAGRNEDECVKTKMTALGKINMVPGGGFPCLRVDETDGVVASQRTKEAAAFLAVSYTHLEKQGGLMKQ